MSKFIVTYRQNNGYRETFDSLEELQKYFFAGQDAKKLISYIKEVKDTYEDKRIEQLLTPEIWKEFAEISWRGKSIKVGSYITYDFSVYSTFYKQHGRSYDRAVAEVIALEMKGDCVRLKVIPRYYDETLFKIEFDSEHQLNPQGTEYDYVYLEDIEDVVTTEYLSEIKAKAQYELEEKKRCYEKEQANYNRVLDTIKEIL